MKSARQSLTAAARQGRLYLLGGANDDQFLDCAECLDSSSNTLADVPAMCPISETRHGHSAGPQHFETSAGSPASVSVYALVFVLICIVVVCVCVCACVFGLKTGAIICLKYKEVPKCIKI